MNERIRQFAEQAITDDLPTPIAIPTEFVVRLAELIVKECAKAAYKYTDDSKNYEHYDDIGWDCLPGDLQSHIKEHFGVEK